MIRTLEAVRFDEVEQTGRNRPLRIAAVESYSNDDNAIEIEVFLKPSAREIGIDGIALELLSACLAGDLGLPICEPVLVEMSPEWIATIPELHTKTILQNSCPLAFGSVNAGNGWRIWSSADKVNGNRRSTALKVFVFDALMENSDRRDEKPNLLVKGDEMRAIDHELAFRVENLIPPARPWQIGYMDSLISPKRHIFGHLLKGDHRINLDEVRTAWEALSEQHLTDYVATIPSQWSDSEHIIEIALTHLSRVRDNLNACFNELERVLS